MADLAVSVRPLDVEVDPLDICGAYGAVGDVVLVGSWAGGGAILATDPVLVASGGADPFDVLNGPVEASTPGAPVGGGWFGSLGFGAGRRSAATPAGPSSYWAFYPNVLRYEAASGQWFDEALVGSTDWVELDDRRARSVSRLRSAATDADRPDDRSAEIGPFTPSFTRAEYERAVAAAQQLIGAGEIYQVNLCLALTAAVHGSSATLFERLMRRLRPAFGAHLVGPHGAIVSASPELFLRRAGPDVLSSPIKGTRPRPDDSTAAADEARRLSASAKDRAENVMIVDMVRNDLARVAATGAVRVADLLRLEAHPGVWHLVSDVTAAMRPGASDADLVRAAFPPGSVTGAPKLRALEVIDALEPVPRGVYTGAIGYRSPSAGLQLSVAIRTLEIDDGLGRLGVGAGITAGSDPSEEWWECFDKAAPIVAALGTVIADGETTRPGLRAELAQGPGQEAMGRAR